MNIVLVEPSLSGHHKVFLSAFVDVLLKNRHKVIVLSTSINLDLSPIVDVKFISYKMNCNFPRNSLLKKIIVVRNLLFLIKNYRELSMRVDAQIDLVFFCSIDGYMHELMPVAFFEMLFPFKFSGLLLSPRRMYKNIIKSRYCSSIGVLDEFYFEQRKKNCERIIHFPDFADDSPPSTNLYLVQKIKERAGARKIILLIGGIVPRKGIYTYVETANRMKYFPCFFVMIGHCSFLAEREYLFVINNFANQSNCFFCGERLQNESDFNAIVSICDIIYAAYVNFNQSSNMLAKSSLFKKPIIVSKDTYMEEIVERYKMGESIRPNSSEDCMIAIFDIINSAHNYLQADWDLYLKKNRENVLFDSFREVCAYAKNYRC